MLFRRSASPHLYHFHLLFDFILLYISLLAHDSRQPFNAVYLLVHLCDVVSLYIYFGLLSVPSDQLYIIITFDLDVILNNATLHL